MSATTGEQPQVMVWVGRFPARERLDAYFDETDRSGAESGTEEERSVSEFAVGQGECFYDHDFLEVHFSPEPTTEIRSLLEGHSFSTSYLDAVAQRVFRYALDGASRWSIRDVIAR